MSELDEGSPPREPILNVPGIVTAVLVFMWAIEALRVYALSPEANISLLVQTAFIPVRYAIPLSEQSLAWAWSPLTYSFLHGGFGHLIVNSVWLVAFGAVVARRIGAARFCVFWIATAVAAAGLHLALHWGEQTPVIGASGVVSGLMGAASRFAFPQSGRFRRETAHFLPRLSIAESLSNRTVLIFLGVWFAINALTAFGFGTDPRSTAQVAWEAHIGGFLCGFIGFSLFDRRGWH